VSANLDVGGAGTVTSGGNAAFAGAQAGRHAHSILPGSDIAVSCVLAGLDEATGRKKAVQIPKKRDKQQCGPQHFADDPTSRYATRRDCLYGPDAIGRDREKSKGDEKDRNLGLTWQAEPASLYSQSPCCAGSGKYKGIFSHQSRVTSQPSLTAAEAHGACLSLATLY
jgi:hypothetical protein